MKVQNKPCAFILLFSVARSVLGSSNNPTGGQNYGPSSSYYDDDRSPPPPPPAEGSPSFWDSPPQENRQDDDSSKISSQNFPPPPPPGSRSSDNMYDRQAPVYSQQGFDDASNFDNDERNNNNNKKNYNENRPFQNDNQSSYQGFSNDRNSDSNSRSSTNTESRDPNIPKLPIHYDFPAVTENSNKGQESNDDAGDDEKPKFASARRDAVTTYMSTSTGRVKVVASSAMIGGGSGVFLAKSTMIPIGVPVLGTLGATSFLVGTFFRTPFGELVRALGLSLILVLERTSKIRRMYPTWRYVAAFFGLSSRNLRPFPPARNPWRYTPRRPSDVDFSMLYSIIAMAFVGSFCGGNMPVIPTWIGSIAGAALFALGCTLSSAKGDLCRTMGMRVVAVLQELWDIQADLKIIPKAAVVSGQVIDKLMIFDRKHRVKDRFLALVTRGYDQVMESTSQMQDRGGRKERNDPNSERRRELRDGPRREDEESSRRRRQDEPFSDREREDRGRAEDRDRRDYRRDDDRYRYDRDDDNRGEKEDSKPKRGRFWRK